VPSRVPDGRSSGRGGAAAAAADGAWSAGQTGYEAALKTYATVQRMSLFEYIR